MSIAMISALFNVTGDGRICYSVDTCKDFATQHSIFQTKKKQSMHGTFSKGTAIAMFKSGFLGIQARTFLFCNKNEYLIVHSTTYCDVRDGFVGEHEASCML